MTQAGSYIVRELLGESLIIARDATHTLRGFFNVCRHRGSRVCDRDGHGSRLVCPYHAWSYRLDGTFGGALGLPDTVDRTTLGLKPVQLAEVAAQRNYPTAGNWKLVLENFIECYHCIPAHAEYCRVMKHVDVVAREDAAATAAWQGQIELWSREKAARESPLAVNPSVLQSAVCRAARAPIGGDRQTQSENGLPVAPLMGQLAQFDGGVSAFRCEPFIFLAALNDHAVLFHSSPIDAEHTDVGITWLVDGNADDSQVDIDRMTWLWDVTTRQDKVLIERNGAGVRSRAYGPGPYSRLESLPARFIARYLGELGRM